MRPSSSEADSAAVQAYVVNQSRIAIAFCESEYPDVYPELFGTACTKRVVAQSGDGVAPVD